MTISEALQVADSGLNALYRAGYHDPDLARVKALSTLAEEIRRLREELITQQQRLIEVQTDVQTLHHMLDKLSQERASWRREPPTPLRLHLAEEKDDTA